MKTTVFRVEKSREYVVMNHKFLREKQMSLKAKGLLALCLSLPDDWEYSLNGLVSIVKESQTSMRSALKELQQFGYLKRNRMKDAKGQFQYEYVLYEVPYDGFVYADNQSAQNVPTEKRQTENVRQQSIEEQSIDKQNIDRENKEIEINNILIDSVHNQELFELYKDYIQMREEMNAPLTPKGLQMLIKRNERLSKNNVKVQCLLLENSLLNGWKNVFLPTEKEIEMASEEIRGDLKAHFGLD